MHGLRIKSVISQTWLLNSPSNLTDWIWRSLRFYAPCVNEQDKMVALWAHHLILKAKYPRDVRVPLVDVS